MQDQSVKCC